MVNPLRGCSLGMFKWPLSNGPLRAEKAPLGREGAESSESSFG